MKEERNFEVKLSEVGMRVDLYLAFKNNDLTRSFIKNLIIKRNIELNSIIGVHSAYKVKNGDKIKLIVDELVETSVKAENIELNIIFENINYIILDKAYGMVVHPANGNWSGTLANALLYHYEQMKNVGDMLRPGIVHRLDKDTSGVMIIAKNNEYMWWLTRQFAERKVQKIYYCLVLGRFNISEVQEYHNSSLNLKIEDGFLKVESKLNRSKINNKIVTNDIDGKYSVTFIKPVQFKQFSAGKNNYTFTLCEVMPKTGRTHQIRSHLKSLGFPIWGDPLYMSHKQLNIVNDICNMGFTNRLFLHAKKITFKDKSGEEKNYEAPLPKELQKIIT